MHGSNGLTKPALVAPDDLRQVEALARQSDDELRQMIRGT